MGDFLAIKTYYGNNQKLNSEFIRYHSKVAKIYDTFALFDSKEVDELMEQIQDGNDVPLMDEDFEIITT